MKVPRDQMEPQPIIIGKRQIVVEPHILAYLGHYMRTFEESIKRKIMSQCTLAQSQSSQSNIASAHGRS